LSPRPFGRKSRGRGPPFLLTVQEHES